MHTPIPEGKWALCPLQFSIASETEMLSHRRIPTSLSSFSTLAHTDTSSSNAGRKLGFKVPFRESIDHDLQPGNWSSQQHSSNLPAWGFLKRHRNSYYMCPFNVHPMALPQVLQVHYFAGNGLVMGVRLLPRTLEAINESSGDFGIIIIIFQCSIILWRNNFYQEGILAEFNKQEISTLTVWDWTYQKLFGIRYTICNVVYGGLEPNPNGNHTRCVIVVVKSGELLTAIDPPGPLSEIRVREFGNPRGYLYWSSSPVLHMGVSLRMTQQRAGQLARFTMAPWRSVNNSTGGNGL